MDTAGVAYVHTHTHAHARTHMHTHAHTYNKIFSSRKQKKEMLQFAPTCLDFEDIVLSRRKTITV